MRIDQDDGADEQRSPAARVHEPFAGEAGPTGAIWSPTMGPAGPVGVPLKVWSRPEQFALGVGSIAIVVGFMLSVYPSSGCDRSSLRQGAEFIAGMGSIAAIVAAVVAERDPIRGRSLFGRSAAWLIGPIGVVVAMVGMAHSNAACAATSSPSRGVTAASPAGEQITTIIGRRVETLTHTSYDVWSVPVPLGWTRSPEPRDEDGLTVERFSGPNGATIEVRYGRVTDLNPSAPWVKGQRERQVARLEEVTVDDVSLVRDRGGIRRFEYKLVGRDPTEDHVSVGQGVAVFERSDGRVLIVVVQQVGSWAPTSVRGIMTREVRATPLPA